MIGDYLFGVAASGGWVLLPIVLVGAAGFYLAGLTFLGLGHEYFIRRNEIFLNRVMSHIRRGQSPEALAMLKKKPGLMTYALRLVLDNDTLSEEKLRSHLGQKLTYRLGLLDHHLPLIAILAAAAPLLGLLGTVTGMVHTFDVIHEYGNSNPILLADGISEALITTQSGLLIAFPLLLCKHHLEDHINWIKKQVELRVTECLNHGFGTREDGRPREARGPTGEGDLTPAARARPVGRLPKQPGMTDPGQPGMT